MTDRIIESLGGRWAGERGWGNFEFTVGLNKDRWTTPDQLPEGMGEIMIGHLDESCVSQWGIEFTYPMQTWVSDREEIGLVEARMVRSG